MKRYTCEQSTIGSRNKTIAWPFTDFSSGTIHWFFPLTMLLICVKKERKKTPISLKGITREPSRRHVPAICHIQPIFSFECFPHYTHTHTQCDTAREEHTTVSVCNLYLEAPIIANQATLLRGQLQKDFQLDIKCWAWLYGSVVYTELGFLFQPKLLLSLIRAEEKNMAKLKDNTLYLEIIIRLIQTAGFFVPS